MMLSTKQFLKQGLQIGPWKVTRKLLLMVVAVCCVVLAFGTLMLETHAFDRDWDDDDNSEESYDDDDDDWEFGGGDMIMTVIMGIAGLVMILCVFACCFAHINPPSHLDQRGSEQVFTIQLTKPSIGPQHSQSLSHYQHYQEQLQQYEQQYQNEQQQQQSRAGGSQHRHQQQSLRGQPAPPRASAPAHVRSPPPPYSLPDHPPSAAPHTHEKPPPYTP